MWESWQYYHSLYIKKAFLNSIYFSEVIMKKFSSLLAVIFLLFSSSLSYAGLEKKLTPQQEADVQESSTKICEGTVPLYGIALDAYYKNNATPAVRSIVGKQIDRDTKKKLYYTEYLEKEPLIDAVIRSTEPHAKKIMEKYPNNQEKYKASIDVTKKITLPPVCRAEMAQILRQILLE